MREPILVAGTQRVPFWRDVRVLALLGQVLFVALVVLITIWLYGNVTSGLRRIGISGGYGFMNQSAGFEIGVKPIPYTPSDSYWRAFQVGVVNTLLVTGLGIVLATILGIIMGVAQLSSNWLIARLARAYVGLFRNIPVLVQLYFWYQALFLRMPRVQQAVELPGPVFLSNRGVAMVGLTIGPTLGAWLGFVLGGALIGAGLWYVLRRLQMRTGRQLPRGMLALLVVLIAAGLGWLLVGAAPLGVELPVRRGLNFSGGWRLAPEYAALLLGLVIYTGAFIAENVRAGIQSISRGQQEAARALGLTPMQSMRLVILPQALRVIIPPTTSQYLNLAKNSSLAIAIGYPDLFSVAATISNQTGQTLPVLGLIIGSYLSISLITSLLMNLYNRRVRLVER